MEKRNTQKVVAGGASTKPDKVSAAVDAETPRRVLIADMGRFKK